MAVSLADWEFCVERGPGWLIVRPIPNDPSAAQSFDLAQAVWSLLQQQFTYRLVLEMDRVEQLCEPLVEEIVLLQKWIDQQGGVLRVCGLNPACQRALQETQLRSRLGDYRTRAEAILGPRPKQPR